MKIQTTALMLMTGLLALINLPASAQDKPDAPPAPPGPAAAEKPDTPRPAPPPPGPGRPQGDMHRVREPDRELEKAIAYLGLLTNPVSRDLQAQFDLPEGFGLQIVEVMPDSPAKAAGLKEYDVLLNFDDQKLVNMEQLQTLVRSKKKGDSVVLTVLSGGQRRPVPVTIGERMVKLSDEQRPRGGFMPGMPSERNFFERREHRSPEEFREQAEQFQDRLRDYQKRMEEWTREGRRGTMPPPPMFDGPRDGSNPRRGGDVHREGEYRRDGDRGPGGPGGPREGEGRRPDGPRDMPKRPEGNSSSSSSSSSSNGVRTSESASITRSDETGIYSLQKTGDQAVFSVTPKDGEAKSWPVGTEEQRAAVPEPYRTKLREMEEIRSSVRRDGERRPEGRAQETPPPVKRPDGV